MTKQEGFSAKIGRLQQFGNQERALLVGIFRAFQKKEEGWEFLQELKRLSITYGIDPVKMQLCPLKKVNAATFLGKGKVLELALAIEQDNIDLVILDEEISPQQQRNLEKVFKKPVVDRSELILGVFAKRAQTKEARVQVELARYEYQLPRLAKMWGHLGRQRTGGSSSGKGGGYLRGEGEKQIEIDRKILKTEIAHLKKQLQEITKHRIRQREARKRQAIPTFALIGYTNAGKSTLLNALTEAGVFVQDTLFATLDTKTCQYQLPSQNKILLIDTVGFIRKLPHHLVASFKSTLEELTYADAFLHVIDASDSASQEQAKVALHLLKEFRVEDKPVITVFNKMDSPLQKSGLFPLFYSSKNSVKVSAKKKEGFDNLIQKMERIISSFRKKVKLRLPQKEYSFLCRLKEQGKVEKVEYEGNDIIFTIELPKSWLGKVKPYLEKGY